MPLFRPLFAVLLAATALPALAQDANLDRRVGRLESELKAVQRKVFPGGNGKYFEPEVAPVIAPVAPIGVPATSPVADLTTRVDALERQLQSITGQVEQANFRARQVEEALAKFRADAEFRMTQLEGGAPTAAAPTATTAPLAVPPAAVPGAKPAPIKPATAAPKLPAPKPADLASTDVAMPAAAPTDPVEAEFQAAYSLYQNKRYTEAQAALSAFVAKRGKSKRASSAQYWLGRSYFSDKQPALAAKAFLSNFQSLPRGDRAVDSLLWLGQSLMAITPPSPAKACEVYDEVTRSYAAKLTPQQTAQLAKGRTTAKCAP